MIDQSVPFVNGFVLGLWTSAGLGVVLWFLHRKVVGPWGGRIRR